MNKIEKMETVRLTLSFEYDKKVVYDAVNMVLSQMNQPAMSEGEIIAEFCKEEPTIIPTRLTEDINMLTTYICLMQAATKKKFDE